MKNELLKKYLHDNHILGYQLSDVHDVKLVEDTLKLVLKTKELERKKILETNVGVLVYEARIGV
jgi:putative transposase